MKTTNEMVEHILTTASYGAYTSPPLRGKDIVQLRAEIKSLPRSDLVTLYYADVEHVKVMDDLTRALKR